MEFQFELAKENERDEILALYKMQLGREFCAWDDHYPSEDTIQFDLLRQSLFVAKNTEGKIVSAISIDDDPEVTSLSCWHEDLNPSAELSRLAVHVEYQNRGLARTMILNAMEVLREREYKGVHFLVNKYNEKALNSYRHLEFTEVGTCTLFNQPFICFEKVL